MIGQYVKEHKHGPRAVLYNLSRSREEFFSYEAAEQAKDGLFAASKYESFQVFINSPHIIVMANWSPDVAQMSEHRWRIYKIEEREGLVEDVAALIDEPVSLIGAPASWGVARRAEQTGGEGTSTNPFTWGMPSPTAINDTDDSTLEY